MESRYTSHNGFDCNEEEEHAFYAMQLTSLSILPMAMQAVVDLQVLEIIARAGDGAQLSANEIVGKMPTSNPNAPAMLDRILALLASHDILTCSAKAINGRNQRFYGLRPVATHLVPNQQGVSFAPLMTLLNSKVMVDCGYELKGAILEGGLPFDRTHGMHAFEYNAKDPKFGEAFNKAMFNVSTLIIKKVIQFYKGFENLTTIVDVGGGIGVTLSLITLAYPHIKGINFDQPHVIQHAPHFPGVEHVGGDMFESVPKGDAILMKWILHDWDDEHCLKLLVTCHKALPDNGKVIVVEGIYPLVPGTNTATKNTCQSDMMMLIHSPGGKERTPDEYLALATKAGFAGIELPCFNLIEFYK